MKICVNKSETPAGLFHQCNRSVYIISLKFAWFSTWQTWKAKTYHWACTMVCYGTLEEVKYSRSICRVFHVSCTTHVGNKMSLLLKDQRNDSLPFYHHVAETTNCFCGLLTLWAVGRCFASVREAGRPRPPRVSCCLAGWLGKIKG
jgi:hypothetical protein